MAKTKKLIFGLTGIFIFFAGFLPIATLAYIPEPIPPPGFFVYSEGQELYLYSEVMGDHTRTHSNDGFNFYIRTQPIWLLFGYIYVVFVEIFFPYSSSWPNLRYLQIDVSYYFQHVPHHCDVFVRYTDGTSSDEYDIQPGISQINLNPNKLVYSVCVEYQTEKYHAWLGIDFLRIYYK
ncbi:MAG: hypothetical protein ACFFCL_05845 [Promethearchaeota archaeon]